jgi:hypothetical protein
MALPAIAQTNGQPQGQTRGTFRGRIIDADTGQPATRDVTIVVTKQGESDATRRVIDVKDEFVVSDLSPGRYRIAFRDKGLSLQSDRYVQVTGLAPITPVDIHLRLLAGEIYGVVANREGEPLQGARVIVVTIQYFAGQTVYTAYSEMKTDDRGSFSFSGRIESGRPYFLLALPPEAGRPTLSGTTSPEAMWYPSRPGLLQPFVLRSSERKRVDFVLEKKPTHCVDGRLTENGKPAALNFEIAIPEIARYRGSSGGTQGVVSRGESDASGAFRACGLWAGEFLLAAGMNKEPERPGIAVATTPKSYGRATVSIVDSDVHDVRLNTQSPVTLSAEVRLDTTEVPEKTYRLDFTPFSRVAFESGGFAGNRFDVVAPSRFKVSLLPSTDYMLRLVIPGAPSETYSKAIPYLKDVTCGGTVRRDSLKLGDSDCGLLITIGTDMGTLTVTIVDKDNKDDLNSSVCVYPSSAVTREEIASMGTCSIDRGTASVPIPLRPDRYFAVAVPQGGVDWVDYILTNRSQGTPIEIKPHSTLQVTLKSNNTR